jgi:hypothetical protein
MGSFNVALLEALLSAGVSPERARAVVDLFDRSIDERYALHAQVLSTKRDIAEMQTATARDIGELRAATARDIGDMRTATARDIGELQTATARDIARVEARLSREIAEGKVDLVKWVLGALTAQTALLLGAAKLF